ncbi:hypothetical protein ASPTUDRAFT_45524 [Aspergillus tubingensis CBS 134.48]|uniref:Uncharacterized protein n=1 Tax=Aspergillus tubingensis (strain CBS 134.48) TaxID=767770 RepID=A0A1L9MYP3_ASPTC|nr:hypothetical protein ASPTUDRAFT_45524 [Aspergillus tubingensis CBS 134.48]
MIEISGRKLRYFISVSSSIVSILDQNVPGWLIILSTAILYGKSMLAPIPQG